MARKSVYKISGKLKKRRQRLTVINVALSVVLGVSVLATAFLGTVWFAFGDMVQTDIPDDTSDLGIVSFPEMREGIRNIALFGVDAREQDSTLGNADTIMVLSINTKAKTAKLVSILRDSYVPIKGYGTRKINAAYLNGGPVLAINTINRNFGLDITDYVTVNFLMLAELIDEVGGIDVEITEAERGEINRIIPWDEVDVPYEIEFLDHAGLVHMNGAQALMYARIRYIDGDQARSERQAKVLNLMLEKVKKMSITKYPGILKTAMGNVETSLSYTEILSYAPLIADLGTMEHTYVPDESKDKNVSGGLYGANGAWVWRYDIDAAADRIHDFLYGDGEEVLSGVSSTGRAY